MCECYILSLPVDPPKSYTTMEKNKNYTVDCCKYSKPNTDLIVFGLVFACLVFMMNCISRTRCCTNHMCCCYVEI